VEARRAQIVRRLQLHRRCTDLPVHELACEDVRRYLEERFPGAGFPTTLAPMLHRYTDGNPLFVVAFVDHMLLRGWILDSNPGWVLSASREELPLEIPDDAQRVIEMQFESLSPADRELVEAASAAGPEFPVEAVAAALSCAVEETERRCEVLARAHGFLRVAGDLDSLDDSPVRRYAFSHELYRDAAYARIPQKQRQRLHRCIGEALERVHGERAVELAPELAVHFERAHDYARAVRHLAAAAVRARQRFAWREAIGCLESAIRLTARLPDDEGRRRELELRLALWPLLSDIYGYASEKLRANCERAYELCTEVGTPQQLFQSLYALCHVHGLRADKVRAPTVAAELDGLATRLGTSECRQFADTVLARFALMHGRYRDACRIAEGGLAGRLRDLGWTDLDAIRVGPQLHWAKTTFGGCSAFLKGVFINIRKGSFAFAPQSWLSQEKNT
jgi:predicted ATPase